MTERKAQDLASFLQTEAAERLAHTLVVALERAEGEQRPLSPDQRTDLLAAALMTFDGTQSAFAKSIQWGSLIRGAEIEEPPA